jgi:hypothetical protein
MSSIGNSNDQIAAAYSFWDALGSPQGQPGEQSTVGSTKCEVIDIYIVPKQWMLRTGGPKDRAVIRDAPAKGEGIVGR